MPESIKYRPLENFLRTHVGDTVTLSFSTIEEILEFKLPASAYTYIPWWDNNSTSHTQRLSWINAGWEVTDKQLGESITFKKVR